MKKLFSSKEIYKVKSRPVDPDSMGEPTNADEFLQRGMAHYARKQFNEAESDLRQSISKDSDSIDANYGLGMVLKAMDRKAEACAAFNHVLELISKDTGDNTTRNDMLRRLAMGHINIIQEGDWNLEKEIWKHTT